MATKRGGNNFTLREEINGKKRHQPNNNAKSMSKFRHLQQLATVLPSSSLSAFFGNRFAAYGETIHVPIDPSLFPCQRCETLLQPGLNCAVRIVKNKAKVRHPSKKPNNPSQNHVVYNCHFCSHCNLKRGTPKGHMMGICPPKDKRPSKSPLVKREHTNDIFPQESTFINLELTKDIFSPNAKISVESTDTYAVRINEILPPKTELASELSLVSSQEIPNEVKVEEFDNNDEIASPPIIIPATPMRATLLEVKKRKRKKSAFSKIDVSSANKIDEEKEVSISSKRRRKTWTSLKEIAETGQQDTRNQTNLTIPFFL